MSPSSLPYEVFYFVVGRFDAIKAIKGFVFNSQNLILVLISSYFWIARLLPPIVQESSVIRDMSVPRADIPKHLH